MDRDSPQSSDLHAIIDFHAGLVHNQDVGPLFGQLAALAHELQHDMATRSCYREAAGAALAFEPQHYQASTVVIWTHLVTRMPERRAATSEAPAGHDGVRNRRRRHHSRHLRG